MDESGHQACTRRQVEASQRSIRTGIRRWRRCTGCEWQMHIGESVGLGPSADERIGEADEPVEVVGCDQRDVVEVAVAEVDADRDLRGEPSHEVDDRLGREPGRGPRDAVSCDDLDGSLYLEQEVLGTDRSHDLGGLALQTGRERSCISQRPRRAEDASSSNGREPTSRARRVIALTRRREGVAVVQADSCRGPCRKRNDGPGDHRARAVPNNRPRCSGPAPPTCQTRHP